MSVDIQVVPYTAQRIIFSSSKPYDAVVADLRELLNAAKGGPEKFHKIGSIKSAQELDDLLYSITEGKRDFSFFGEMPHSTWMDSYLGKTHKRTIIFTLGNPLAAKEMMKHDMRAGLHAPARWMIQENDNGGTSIEFDLPSSVVPGGVEPTPELKAAAEFIDGKFYTLAKKVLGEGI